MLCQVSRGATAALRGALQPAGCVARRRCRSALSRRCLNTGRPARSATAAARRLSHDDCAHSMLTLGKRVPHVNCWRCDKKGLDCVAERFFCRACGALQPPVKCVNYFQYLDTDVAYALDVGELKRRYREIVAALHPDRFASASHVEIDYSARQASVINRAYKTVSEPVERALYLLRLNGVPFDDDTVNTRVDPEFLMEMLELNEQAEDAADTAELEAMRAECLRRNAECERRLADAFGGGDLRAAAALLARMKYFLRVVANVQKRLGFDE